MRNLTNISKQVPPDVRRAIRTFRERTPTLAVWRTYGADAAEAETDTTDGYGCDVAARGFARELSRHGIRQVELVHCEDSGIPLHWGHWWTRVTTRDGSVLNVDWTARQFFNLEDPPNPRHANIPCPLVWYTGEQVPENTHPVTGTYATVTVTEVVPCAYCGDLTVATGAVRDDLSGWDWPDRGHVVACKKCAGIVRCSAGHDWDAAEYTPTPDACPAHDPEQQDRMCSVPGVGHQPDSVRPGPGKWCIHCGHLLLPQPGSAAGQWDTVHRESEPCHCQELTALATAAPQPDQPTGGDTVAAFDNTDDDWMYNGATLAARACLVEAIASHDAVTSARVTCNQCPLIVEGELSDGRVFMFRARHGVASLAIAVPNQDDEPVPIQTACPEGLAVDEDTIASEVFTMLLAEHGLH